MRYEYCLICTQRYDERDLKLKICLHCRDKINNLEEPYVRSLEELNIHPFDSLTSNRIKPNKNTNPRREGLNLHSIRQRLKTHQLGKV